MPLLCREPVCAVQTRMRDRANCPLYVCSTNQSAGRHALMPARKTDSFPIGWNTLLHLLTIEWMCLYCFFGVFSTSSTSDLTCKVILNYIYQSILVEVSRWMRAAPHLSVGSCAAVCESCSSRCLNLLLTQCLFSSQLPRKEGTVCKTG